MNEKSPFEQWRENHLYQIAVSPEILKLIVEAFQGGRLYEMQPFQKQEWVGLTDEEKIKLWDRAVKRGAYQGVPAFIALIQEVEAKLRSKNHDVG